LQRKPPSLAEGHLSLGGSNSKNGRQGYVGGQLRQAELTERGATSPANAGNEAAPAAGARPAPYGDVAVKNNG